eukprot:2461786-Rhodomonas_salina.2
MLLAGTGLGVLQWSCIRVSNLCICQIVLVQLERILLGFLVQISVYTAPELKYFITHSWYNLNLYCVCVSCLLTSGRIGYQLSGFGKECGPDALNYYSQIKSVYVAMDDVWTPY